MGKYNEVQKNSNSQEGERSIRSKTNRSRTMARCILKKRAPFAKLVLVQMKKAFWKKDKRKLIKLIRRTWDNACGCEKHFSKHRRGGAQSTMYTHKQSVM